MRRVSYAGESFVTTDEIADALMLFTAEIARGGSSETVTIPALDSENNIIDVMVVIGPATEVISVPETDAAEVEMGNAALAIREHTDALLAQRSAPKAFPLDGVLPASDELD